MASSRYISSMSAAVIPTASSSSPDWLPSMVLARMYARMADSFISTPATTSVSPAENRLARYSRGIRRSVMAWKTLSGSSASAPTPVTASSTGDSGGMYQTMGIVRYSGCSGSATRYFTASRWIGERRAAAIQSSLIPAARAAAMTAGSSGSRKTRRCASRRSRGSSTRAASSTASASYRMSPM